MIVVYCNAYVLFIVETRRKYFSCKHYYKRERLILEQRREVKIK